MNNEELWQATLAELEVLVSKANFITWFQNTSITAQQNGMVVLNVPNAFAKEWLECKYHKFILKALRSLSPEVRNVEYIISSQTQPLLQKNKFTQVMIPHEEQLEFKEFLIDRETNLNPRYTFDSFVVGPFNELAHAAALAVSKNPGVAYNPLFIYGGVGLGKTHLLEAVGNEIKKINSKLKVRYISSERFTNELISSIQNNETSFFKEKYRSYDCLILDDVQFIAGKIKTQEEFFHIFNALYESGKQVVFSSDKPPHAIPELEERLRSRFAGGVITDIGQPEYESRLAILKSKAEGKENYVNMEILEFIALNIQKNIRELEGALNAVIAKVKMTGKIPSSGEVKEILMKIMQPRRIVTANQIIKSVAEFYDLDEKILYEKTRKKEVVKPRQVAMYLLREDFNGSYPYIGRSFGGRDHTTAIHAYEKISKELKNSVQFMEEIRRIRELYNYKT